MWVHARRQTLGGLGRAAGGRNFAVVPDPIPQILYPRSGTQILRAIFLWSHLSVENRSLVDFKQINEAYGGDLAEKSSFKRVKRIAAECFSKWGAILQKQAVLQ